ncbi:protein BatD [Alteromonas sediminis]|uniref:Protein BatD n=1 Tax=Alteromonas sediminis TaxID=2259342 RepID=A0A3N5YQK2_9ALTE|nr:BatD family protein [Alteromonas sediminis]RPJ68451.1 protein BatD [Alteromonas sediminis]
MVRTYFNGLIGLVLCLLFTSRVIALEVTATVDKNPVLLDEAITLIVKATGDVDREAFQSDSLLKDFVVGNTSVSSQTQMINFDTTRTTTWRTILFPKQEGTFTIPSIEIMGERTQPIDIRVLPVPTTSTQEQRDFFVTAELDRNRVYVQQHVTYTVKLYMATNIERGSLQSPEMENGRIEQVGDDKQYSDIVNGKRFQIIERTFVLIPEQSGQFTIQAPIFSGEVLATNTRQSFGFFNRTRNITRRGPLLTLDVKPIPSSIDGAWLPSKYVEITESWPDNKEFVVGEPITRTLTLTVEGQTEEQLPEIPQIYPPSVKTYQDQAETKSAQQEGRILAQRIESTAIIPTQEGSMVLPGVEVPWFNVETQQIEVASIPAKTVQVNPAVGLQTSQAAPVTTLSPSLPEPEETQPLVDTSQASPSILIWQVLSGVFALLWLITLAAWWTGRTAPQQAPVKQRRNQTQRADKKALLAALKQADTAQLQPLLWQWLNDTLGQSFSSLHDALAHPEAHEIKMHYAALTASKFSPSTSTWTPDNFAQAITTLEKKLATRTTQEDGTLPSLYPAA